MSRQHLPVLLSLLTLLAAAAALQPPTPLVRDSLGNVVTLPDLPGSTIFDSFTMHTPTVDVNPYTLYIDMSCAHCHLSLGYQMGNARLLSTSPAIVVLGGHYDGQYDASTEYVLRFHIPSSGRLALNLTYTAVDTQQDVIVEVSVNNPYAAE